MSKMQQTIYICDRCGCTIAEIPHNLGHFKYMNVLKWFVPQLCEYKLTYLCSDCWNGLKRYLGGQDVK